MQLKRDDNRTVFSTETGRICPECGKPIQKCQCKKNKITSTIKQDGIVRLRIERKGRGGKSVTLIEGLPFNEELLKEISKELKKQCGVGGALKNGIIELQGDVRDSVLTILKSKGYSVKKSGS